MTITTQSISPLRQRMIDDMRIRKLCDKTQTHYIRAVRQFAGFLGRSPDTATIEDLRRYQLRLVDHGISPVSLNAAITGLKFFFERPPCVLLIDQTTEQQIAFIDRLGLFLRINRGAGYARQNTLLDHGGLIPFANPRLPHHDRLIPDFFLSQSNSIFSLPISLYSNSGSR